MMDIDQIRALYDREQRIDVQYPHMQREEAPGVVRHVASHGGRSIVQYSRLDKHTVDQAIRDQIAYFGNIGQDFEWKAYAHDQPADLVERLRAHGFQTEEPDAIMLRELKDTSLSTPAHDIRRITDLAQLADVATVRHAVSETGHAWSDQYLRENLRINPDYLSVYVVYVENQPASCAWTFFDEGQFASLWGGATRAEYRGQGLYTTLLDVRMAEARARGKLFVTVDAGTMSRPILERRGFVCIAAAYECTWRVQR
jgi:ribosomal protein S18 acetylase RimI-like enzyme